MWVGEGPSALERNWSGAKELAVLWFKGLSPFSL